MIGYLYHRLPDDGGLAVFESTADTRSIWDPAIQHGSPPLALLTRAVEDLAAGSGLRVGRLTLDILGAIPVAPVRVRTEVLRPGTRISLMAAEMLASRPDGTRRTVARVTAWLLAPSDTADVVTDRYPPLAEGEVTGLAHAWEGAPGYLETVSWRRQADDGNSAVAWLTPLVPLVDDEPTSALQRLAMVVDSANGIGAALDPNEFVFMNTDTRVHLHRAAGGRRTSRLRTRGSIGPDGIGVTTAELFDRRGFIGTSAQTLLVRRRGDRSGRPVRPGVGGVPHP